MCDGFYSRGMSKLPHAVDPFDTTRSVDRTTVGKSPRRRSAAAGGFSFIVGTVIAISSRDMHAKSAIYSRDNITDFKIKI